MLYWKHAASETLQQYDLMNGQQPLATLKCNPSTGSFRLDYGVKRLFFLNALRGTRRKYDLTNEYGYVVARYNQLEGHTATLELGGKTFLCTCDGLHAAICNDRNEELLQCSLPDVPTPQVTILLFASLWLEREGNVVVYENATLQHA